MSLERARWTWMALFAALVTHGADASLPARVSGADAPAIEEGHVLQGRVTVYTKDGRAKNDDANVVVFLDRVDRERPFALPTVNPKMHQRGQQFFPQVLPVVVGTTVDFPNDDHIYHNVFSRSRIRPFDLGTYKQEVTKAVLFDQTGLAMIYCNIHPHMVGYILVLQNPYYAATNAQGRFVIPYVPAGRYTVRAWQRFGQETQQTVEMSTAPFTTINLDVTEEKVSLKHANKWGREYTTKYER